MGTEWGKIGNGLPSQTCGKPRFWEIFLRHGLGNTQKSFQLATTRCLSKCHPTPGKFLLFPHPKNATPLPNTTPKKHGVFLFISIPCKAKGTLGLGIWAISKSLHRACKSSVLLLSVFFLSWRPILKSLFSQVRTRPSA